MGRTGLFDLERHFAFYGAYHSNPVNVLLHTFLVWPLIFTLDVLLHFTPPLYNFPSGLNYHGFELNVGLVLTLMYAIVCVKLDKKAGSLAALLLFLTRVGASVLANGLAFGYEPYPGFNKSVKEKIEAEIKSWKVIKNQKKLS
ncbi:unnamed protein product [Malus baccata var. baccata]